MFSTEEHIYLKLHWIRLKEKIGFDLDTLYQLPIHCEYLK